MNEIIVAGIGPGHPDYMLPAAARAIREAQVLVGGRRALSQFAREGQRTMAVTGDIAAVMQFIREALATSSVVVMVSGDPGYYSLLDALRRLAWSGLEKTVASLVRGAASFCLFH